MLESCRAGWGQRTCTGRLEDRELLWNFWEDCCYALCCRCVCVYTFIMIIRCLAHILKCLHDLHDCVQDLEEREVITLHCSSASSPKNYSLLQLFKLTSCRESGSLWATSANRVTKQKLKFSATGRKSKKQKMTNTYMCSNKKNDKMILY